MLRDILERLPGARLAFVGDGPERESLEQHFAGTRTVFMVCTPAQFAYKSSSAIPHLSAASSAFHAVVLAPRCGANYCHPVVLTQAPLTTPPKRRFPMDFPDVSQLLSGLVLTGHASTVMPFTTSRPCLPPESTVRLQTRPCCCAGVQGMVQGEELLQAYASGDVFMMPSESETLGFVVLEAMASALPVVAVAAGGLTDILTEPGETGARSTILMQLLSASVQATVTSASLAGKLPVRSVVVITMAAKSLC